MPSDTCDGCVYHERVSASTRQHTDFCGQRPGERIVRQRSPEYWPKFPIACSEKKEADHAE